MAGPLLQVSNFPIGPVAERAVTELKCLGNVGLVVICFEIGTDALDITP